jgi:hypothetical protein
MAACNEIDTCKCPVFNVTKITFKEHPNHAYTGEIKHNSVPHGQGKLITTEEEGCNMIGTWKSGKLIKGVIRSANGHRLDGEFRYGKIIKGTINYADGSRQEGDFQDGTMLKGTINHANGTREHGEFKDWCLIKGTINREDGTRYDGDFQDRKLIKGTINFASGTRENYLNGVFVKETISHADGAESRKRQRCSSPALSSSQQAAASSMSVEDAADLMMDFFQIPK